MKANDLLELGMKIPLIRGKAKDTNGVTNC